MDSRKFFYELGKLIYQIDVEYETYGKSESINAPNLLWILYALNDGQPHTQRQICDDWQIPRSTANTIVKDLQKEGLVELSHLNGTRREMTIKLTEKGLSYADSVLQKLYLREQVVYDKMKNPEKFLKDLKSFTEILSLLNKEEN